MKKQSSFNMLQKSSAIVTIAGLVFMSGCANNQLITGSIGRSHKPIEHMSGTELAATKNKYGKTYERDPKNKDFGIAYANILRMNGSNEQALAVMRQIAIYHPNDRGVLAAYGKALAGNGEFESALETVRRAQRPDYPDWRLLSTEGAILDQMGNAAEARALYRKAFDIAPDEASIQSNLGMSYLLEGDLKNAEKYLRAASNSRSADTTVRQNLALAVGLQGRFEEAQKIASRELSLEQTQANLNYLRKMMSQQDSLSQLKKMDQKK
jgi:Flp pilus assembly protein TadD